ncbi:MAG: hypothetical protein RLZZ546_2284 [Bacteroidota bacterium]|jgi:hypothetical protein
MTFILYFGYGQTTFIFKPEIKERDLKEFINTLLEFMNEEEPYTGAVFLEKKYQLNYIKDFIDFNKDFSEYNSVNPILKRIDTGLCETPSNDPELFEYCLSKSGFYNEPTYNNKNGDIYLGNFVIIIRQENRIN